MGKKGLNWAKALPEYQKILNEEPKEVLKYKSSFEVYFARKPSSHTNRAMESEDLVSEELVTNTGRCNPACKGRKRCCRRAQDVRKWAHAATERCHQRMVKTYLNQILPQDTE